MKNKSAHLSTYLVTILEYLSNLGKFLEAPSRAELIEFQQNVIILCQIKISLKNYNGFCGLFLVNEMLNPPPIRSVQKFPDSETLTSDAR